VTGGGGIAGHNVGFRGACCTACQRMSDPLTIEALALLDDVAFAVGGGEVYMGSFSSRLLRATYSLRSQISVHLGFAFSQTL
jgi:hypothetical protein